MIQMEDARVCYNNSAFIHDESTSFPQQQQQNVTIDQGEKQRLQLVWKDVSYRVSSGLPLPGLRQEKRILDKVSGRLTGGSMTALMGPSGCGKTTLLNLVAGKISGSGVSGDISLLSPHRRTNLRIGFVPQQEHMFTMFTVHETVLFASRLNNPSISRENRDKKVQHVLQCLDIERFTDKKLSNLSGGQLKRVSVALELVSDPHILMLDEPTTGLDSMSSESVIQLLKNISMTGDNGPAIVATIHNPSSDVFQLFDRVYLLNNGGSNIYNGAPADLMDFLAGFGFPLKKTNPAEYAIEVANGKFGDEAFTDMADATSKAFTLDDQESRLGSQLKPIGIADVTQTPKSSCLTQFGLLFGRIFSAHAYKSPILLLRTGAMVLMAASMCHLAAKPIGAYDGCVSSALGAFAADDESSQQDRLKQAFLGKDANSTSGLAFDSVSESGSNQTALLFVFLSIMLTSLVSAFISLSLLPLEMATIKRETSNRWYSVNSLYAAMTVNETISLLIGIFAYVSYAFWAAEIPLGEEMFRFQLVFAALLGVGMIWSARGLILAILFYPNNTISMVATLAFLMVNTFFSGFVVQASRMLSSVRPFTMLSDARQSATVFLSAVFGYDRCSPAPSLATYVMDSVMQQRTTMRIATAVWPYLNVTAADLRPLAQKLGLAADDLADLPRAMDGFLGSSEEAIGWEDMEYNPSFVMAMFNLKEDSVSTSFVYVAVAALVAQAFVLLALTLKLRCRRL